MINTDICGVILCGGKSSRMGQNKALLKLGDHTVIGRVAGLMKTIFSDLLLITNEPDKYAFLGLEMYRDIFPHRGPLAGIHSALFHSDYEHHFIISCDLPLMSREMVQYIVDYQSENPVTVYKVEGRVNPLVGKYSQSVMTMAERILKGDPSLKAGKGSVMSLLDQVAHDQIIAEQIEYYHESCFFNLNHPEDYHKILALFDTRDRNTDDAD